MWYHTYVLFAYPIKFECLDQEHSFENSTKKDILWFQVTFAMQ